MNAQTSVPTEIDLSNLAFSEDEWVAAEPAIRYYDVERRLEDALFDWNPSVRLRVEFDSNAKLTGQGKQFNEPNGGKMARRRFQRGMLSARGKVWILKWRDDIIENGSVRRVHRTDVIGSLAEFPTLKLARREADTRLAVVNNPRYRARPQATFAEFAVRWSDAVLIQHKPSTQATIRSHIQKYLVSSFGPCAMKDIEPEAVQRFLSSLKVSGKTVRNIFVTLQMMWKSARAWKYVTHDIAEGVVLPSKARVNRRHFSVTEIQRILTSGDFCVWPRAGKRPVVIPAEPCRTFYWLAAETGLRAGELCGLTIGDVDFTHNRVCVRQSVWHGRLGSTKTANSVRSFAISSSLLERLHSHANGAGAGEFLFKTRNGTAWDANLVVKRKLHPLSRALGIKGGGLHAFRHANASIMDTLAVPMKTRQQRLGHSDITLTMNVYTHVASEDDARAAEQIAGILWSNVAN